MSDSKRDAPQQKFQPCNCPTTINRDDPGNRRCRDNKYLPPQLQPPPQAPSPPPPLLAIPRSRNHDEKILLVTGMTVMVTMLSLVLLLCILIPIVRFYFNKRRRRLPVVFFGTGDDFGVDEDQTIPNLGNPIWYINTVGLQQSVIDSIKVFKYKKDEGLIEGTECSVCLNEFQEDESLRFLPKCSHGFHIPCIDTWLRLHTNCPLCRAPVVCETMVAQTSEENDETGVENDVGEGRTSEEIQDGNTSETSRKNSDGSDPNVLSDLGGIQEPRRSVSLDLCCAIEIASEATAVHKHGLSLGNELEELMYSKGKSSIGKLMKSSSIGRCLSKGPVSMKRSFSSGGIFLLSKQSKSQGSILPL